MKDTDDIAFEENGLKIDDGRNFNREKYFGKHDAELQEHRQLMSYLRSDENKKSSMKIKELTGELFNDDTDSSKDKDINIKNKDINLLKRETISPIENVQNMQILSEDKAIYKIIKSLYEISEQMCKDGKGNEVVLGDVNWNSAKSILSDIINNKEELSPQIRQYLYKLLSDNTKLYNEILDKIGGPFILGADDRGNRGSSESWGIHMGVDYNLPVGTPVKSIYDGKVVGGRSNSGIFGDEKIIKAFEGVKQDNDGGAGNMLIIEHEIGGKTYYSLYMHITDENFQIGQTINKGQEIGKIDGYDTNGHWQPHLHFTIINNLDNKHVLHGYGKKRDLKDMVNPIRVYN